jgi:ABC-type thiamin/hydroxymethylpyrimidine transport system permease subunit
MASWETTYWRLFNILVRVLGLVALLCGIVYIVWGTVRMLQMDFIQPEAASTIAILPVGLLVAAIGAAIIRAPTYRPALGDV